jgi:hypothetical protein
LRRLSVIAAGSGEELQQLFGISNMDATGQLKPLVAILDEINTVTANMPVAERTEKMAKAFGLLGITSANVLSQSAGGVAELAGKLQTADGAAAKTASMMDSGLGGSMRILLSAVEGVALAVGDALAPAMQHIAEMAIKATGDIGSFIKNNEGLVRTIAAVVVGVIAGGVAIYALGTALGVLSGIASVAFAIVSALLSPIGLIVAGVVALGGAVLYAIGAFDGFGETIGTTLSGIYDAIAAGDLSMAFEVLWAGLHLSWLRGVAKLMGYVDPWVSMFQNAFTILGTEIVVIWDRMVSYLASTQWGAALLGTVDNIVNGVMATFDTMVSAVRKSWNFIQSLITSGFDLAKENEKVDTEMAARARKRALDRPGVLERMRRAKEDDGRMAADSEQRVNDMRAAADETMQAREDRNRARAADREAGVAEAQQRLDELRAQAAEAAAAKAAGDAGVADPAEIARQIEEAVPKPQLPTIAPPGASDSEVAGTFSAMALSGMGFGSNLQQRQLEALNRIAENTSDMETGLVAE